MSIKKTRPTKIVKKRKTVVVDKPKPDLLEMLVKSQVEMQKTISMLSQQINEIKKPNEDEERQTYEQTMRKPQKIKTEYLVFIMDKYQSADGGMVEQLASPNPAMRGFKTYEEADAAAKIKFPGRNVRISYIESPMSDVLNIK